MSLAGVDGAWVSATRVTRYDCSECGELLTTRWPTNEREELDYLREHLREEHGGVY
jgi:hypothetical protein